MSKKLSKVTIELLTESIKRVESSEMTQTDVFLMSFELYKKAKESDRKGITEQLKAQVMLLTKFSTTRAMYTRIFKLSEQYTNMYVIAKADILHYTTLSKLVKVLKYIKENESGVTFKKVKDRVAKCWSDGLGEFSYNNIVDNLITTLKDEFKLKEVEGEFKFDDVFNMVEKSLSKMNGTQLQALQTIITKSLEDKKAEKVEVA